MNDKQKIKNLENRIHRLNEIGMALSTESDSNKLFEMILEEARNITNADGRTLYSKDKEGNLKFEILQAFIAMGAHRAFFGGQPGKTAAKKGAFQATEHAGAASAGKATGTSTIRPTTCKF